MEREKNTSLLRLSNIFVIIFPSIHLDLQRVSELSTKDPIMFASYVIPEGKADSEDNKEGKYRRACVYGMEGLFIAWAKAEVNSPGPAKSP